MVQKPKSFLSLLLNSCSLPTTKKSSVFVLQPTGIPNELKIYFNSVMISKQSPRAETIIKLKGGMSTDKS